MRLLFTNATESPGTAISPTKVASGTARQPYPPFTAQFFKPLLKRALAILPKPPLSKQILETEVELVLLNDPAMQAINKQTRGLDKPTDVLSFANREVVGRPPEIFAPGQKSQQVKSLKGSVQHDQSLGQIFISIPAARRNADEMHQSLEEELRFLFIHGLLHILGYDHQTPEGEAEMMTLAYQILGRPSYQLS